MHATIFYLRRQKDDVARIEALLKEHVFQGIDVEKLEISDDYNKYSYAYEHERCRRFLSLFKASMIRVNDFDIAVGDGWGRWYYMGGVYKSKWHHLELFHIYMGSVFPAVAIRDSMVMMPRNVGEAFEKSRVFDWFVKPRDLGGVVLTDFEHS